MHDLPKLLALNDRSGERENLGFGGEKRRLSTGGSAKGIPESEGVRKSGLEDNKRETSEEFEVGRLKTLSYEGCASELQAWWVATAEDASHKGGQEERGENARPHYVPETLRKSHKDVALPVESGVKPRSKTGR